jgi:hypothetical protein
MKNPKPRTIDEVQALHPDLTPFGFAHAKLAREAFRESDYKTIALVHEWLQSGGPKGQPVNLAGKRNGNRNSYGFKHDVEEWFRDRTGSRPYVASGVFTCAAILAGWRPYRWNVDGDRLVQNCRFKKS